MANYMSEVAKILGVELLEEFEVRSLNDTCRIIAAITENGLWIKDHDIAGPDPIHWKPYVLERLLSGKYIINRKPWKPQNGQAFWFVDSCGKTFVDNWSDENSYFFNFYKIGNCYKTHAEAEANVDKWISFYGSMEVLEV